jgi:hypothetical protein
MLLVKEGNPPKEEVFRSGKKPRIIGVRLSEDDYQMFIQLADHAGMKPSNMAQIAILDMIGRIR